MKDVVGVYTGECMKCAEGSSSKFIVGVEWWDKEQSVLQQWHLDSRDLQNSGLRWVNDCVGTKWEGLYNVKYGGRVKDDVHPVYGKYYCEVIAIDEIKKGEELFADYGEQYWTRYCTYYKCHDPAIFVDKDYKEVMKKVFAERRTRQVSV